MTGARQPYRLAVGRFYRAAHMGRETCAEPRTTRVVETVDGRETVDVDCGQPATVEVAIPQADDRPAVRLGFCDEHGIERAGQPGAHVIGDIAW